MPTATRMARAEPSAPPTVPVRAAEPLIAEFERPFRGIFTGSPVGIALTDEDGRVADVNDALCELLGRPRAQLLSRFPTGFGRPGHLGGAPDTAGPDTAGPDTAGPDSARPDSARSDSAPSEVCFAGADGSERWVSLTYGQTPGPQGQRWQVVHVQDTTDRRSVEVALRTSEVALRVSEAALRKAEAALRVSEAALRVSEVALRESEAALRESEAGVLAVGELWRAAHSGADPRPVLVEKLGLLAQASTVSLVERDGTDLVVTASLKADLDGTRIPMHTPSATVWVWKSARELFLGDIAGSPLTVDLLSTVPDAKSILWQPLVDSGVVSGVLTVVWTREVGSLSDRAARAVTLLAHEGARALVEWNRRTQLESDVLTDALTGLPNRRSWDSRLARAVTEAGGCDQPLTVAMVDLDHFKRFNDEFGHLVGDRLLVEFAEAAQGVVRGTDLAARWGGEEFAILLPGCPPEAARAVLERLRAAVPRGQHCSIGYSTWNGSESVDELTTRADQALYLAKHSGRNMVSAL